MLINCELSEPIELVEADFEYSKINCEAVAADFTAGELVISFFAFAIFLFLVYKYIVNDLT